LKPFTEDEIAYKTDYKEKVGCEPPPNFDVVEFKISPSEE